MQLVLMELGGLVALAAALLTDRSGLDFEGRQEAAARRALVDAERVRTRRWRRNPRR